MTKLAPHYFRIRQVAKLLGETQPTLRFWEEQFRRQLGGVERAGSGKCGQRRYTRAHLEALRQIQRLIRVELYTIAGAKRQLRLIGDMRAHLKEGQDA